MMRRNLLWLAVAASLVAAVLVGVAGATVFNKPPAAPISRDASRPAPNPRPEIGATTADRHGDSGMPWAIRTYDSLTGWRCAQLGHSDGTNFGRAEPGRELQPLGIPELGSCADISDSGYFFWVTHYPATPERDAVAVIFGIVAAGASVSLARGGEPSVCLPLRADSFVTELSSSDIDGAVLDVVLQDGTHRPTALRDLDARGDTSTPAGG